MYHDAEQLRFCDKTLKSIRNDNVGRLIFGYLNIIRNKFELLKDQIKGNIGVLKHKLTTPFLIVKFLLKVSIHRIDLIVIQMVVEFFYMPGRIFLPT